jgi:hypothetical protein
VVVLSGLLKLHISKHTTCETHKQNHSIIIHLRDENFLDDNFLLHTKTAQRLYHEYAKEMPIIDYHCHLPPDQIAEDKQFDNLTQIWLYGDHYKWRAMRTNGIDERFCTGSASTKRSFRVGRNGALYTPQPVVPLDTPGTAALF